MFTHSRFLFTTIGVALFSTAQAHGATILNYTTNDESVLTGYGSHVSGATVSDYAKVSSYGTTDGFYTPHVGVTYTAIDVTDLGIYGNNLPDPDYYSPGAGGALAIYKFNSIGSYTMTFTADPTYSVTLESLKIRWSGRNDPGGDKDPLTLAMYIDGSSTAVFYTADSSGTTGTTNSSLLTFSPAATYTGTSIKLEITNRQGERTLDDITFSEALLTSAIPEPATLRDCK